MTRCASRTELTRERTWNQQLLQAAPLPAAADALHAGVPTYSRPRGAFAGISAHGATLPPDNDSHAELDGRKLANEQIVMGKIEGCEPMSTVGNLIAPEAEISKVGEARYCSASNHLQLAPRMTLPKSDGGDLSFPFLLNFRRNNSVIAEEGMMGTVNHVAWARPASSVFIDPVRLSKNRTRGVVQKRRTGCDPVG